VWCVCVCVCVVGFERLVITIVLKTVTYFTGHSLLNMSERNTTPPSTLPTPKKWNVGTTDRNKMLSYTMFPCSNKGGFYHSSRVTDNHLYIRQINICPYRWHSAMNLCTYCCYLLVPQSFHLWNYYQPALMTMWLELLHTDCSQHMHYWKTRSTKLVISRCVISYRPIWLSIKKKPFSVFTDSRPDNNVMNYQLTEMR
jgi:hypothetical protein